MRALVAITFTLLAHGCTAAPISRDGGSIDAAEIDGGPKPVVCMDSDGDGLSDELETGFGALPDVDGDGVPNELDTDSDADGVPDQAEHEPSSPYSCEPPRVSCGGCGRPRFATLDSDGDGVRDGAELVLGTDACDVDSDDDGCPDGLRGCGTERIAAFWIACDDQTVEATFVVPDGPTRARVQAVVDQRDIGSALQVWPIPSEPPSIEFDDTGFSNVPPGATLRFGIRGVMIPVDEPTRFDGYVRLVDGDGALVTYLPLHVVMYDCCTLLI